MIKEVLKMDRKGIVSVHAGVFFLVGLAIGIALMWFLMTKGMVPGLGVAPSP